jgi:hypothetical protein
MSRLTVIETALIDEHRPVINLAGRGYSARGPLIRDDGFKERVRAWWLFRVAWLAVISGEPDAYTRRRAGLRGSTIEVGWDAHGWPVPLESAASRGIVERRSEAAQRKRLLAASPPDLRDAVCKWLDSDEATAWAYAHTGLALVAGAGVTDILADALSRATRQPGPEVLPNPETRMALYRLVSGRNRLIVDVVH